MDALGKIKSIIDPIVSLNSEEFEILFHFFDVKTLSKNDLFLKEGQICDYIGFINYGTVIYSKTLNNGNEVTIDFAFEGDWVTSNESRIQNMPSLINIKAIENTEFLVIKQQDLVILYSKIPELERLARIIMEQSHMRFVQQSVELQTFSARERYESLLFNYPKIFQKVPLYHIANFLGIAPKSLSRIRSEIAHK